MSTAFFGQKDLPVLIRDVVYKKEGSQEAFVEALPIFLAELPAEQVTKQILPFIINWFDFGNLNVAKILFKYIPLLVKRESTELELYDYLYLINELIRQNGLFVEKESNQLVDYLMTIFQGDVFDSIIIPSLERLLWQDNIEAVAISLTMQAKLAIMSPQEKKQNIIENLLRICKNTSTILNIILLGSLQHFLAISNDEKLIIDNLVYPLFKHPDPKLRCRVISAISTVPDKYMAIYTDIKPLIRLSQDESWCVRYSWARTIAPLIEYCTQKEKLGLALMNLCKDSVSEVRSTALITLSKTCKKLSAQTLDDTPNIFELCMRNHSETVRDAAIRLWGALLASHPEADFQVRLAKSLQLLGTVPIFGFIHKMLLHVVPLLPESLINLELIDNAVNTLLDNEDRPTLIVKAIPVLASLATAKNLAGYAPALAGKVKPFLSSPVFAVRVAAGNFFVDCTRILGWEWACEYFLNDIGDMLEEGNTPLRTSALRTATALIAEKPPTEIAQQLREMIDNLTMCKIEVVKKNAELCIEKLVHVH